MPSRRDRVADHRRIEHRRDGCGQRLCRDFRRRKVGRRGYDGSRRWWLGVTARPTSQRQTPEIAVPRRLVRYASPRFSAQNGSVDDDSSHCIQVLEVAISLLGKIRRSAKDQGHLVFQAIGESGVSRAYPIIVTSNLEVIEELNERYAHTCLTTSTRMFLLLVGHALAGECSVDITNSLEHIARVRELPCLSRALSDARSRERRADETNCIKQVVLNDDCIAAF